jgi:ribose transport system permease protein
MRISIREQMWNISIFGLVVVLTFWRGNQLPIFGSYEVKTILLGIVPIALLAMGQSLIIIGGGINLAIGAEAILVNCITAKYSEGTSFITSLKWAVLGIFIAALIGAVTGWIISKSGIADIVVTLATSFVLIGLALFIQPGPGGGVNIDFAQTFSGKGDSFIAPLLVLFLPILLIWLPLHRSRIGISFYAIGSSKDAAFLSGVNVSRTRILLYAFGGIFAGLCGVALTAITQAASPFAVISNTATLNSVAAAVLGGVSLAGGVGGLFGPALASLVLYYIPTIMLGYGIDPAYSQIIQGALTVLVVLIGGLLRARNER